MPLLFLLFYVLFFSFLLYGSSLSSGLMIKREIISFLLANSDPEKQYSEQDSVCNQPMAIAELPDNEQDCGVSLLIRYIISDMSHGKLVIRLSSVDMAFTKCVHIKNNGCYHKIQIIFQVKGLTLYNR